MQDAQATFSASVGCMPRELVCTVSLRVKNPTDPEANSTLFNPVSRIEAVQAMSRSFASVHVQVSHPVLLATFSDESGWLPGGHAVRMALDLGINQAFLLLLKSGMGAGKSKSELEEERPLVVQARVWFCVSRSASSTNMR